MFLFVLCKFFTFQAEYTWSFLCFTTLVAILYFVLKKTSCLQLSTISVSSANSSNELDPTKCTNCNIIVLFFLRNVRLMNYSQRWNTEALIKPIDSASSALLMVHYGIYLWHHCGYKLSYDSLPLLCRLLQQQAGKCTLHPTSNIFGTVQVHNLNLFRQYICRHARANIFNSACFQRLME